MSTQSDLFTPHSRILIENDAIRITDPSMPDRTVPLGSPEGFAVLSRLWLLSGWDTKHQYTFTWHGRPIIQEPEDMFRLQELIMTVQPDVIVESGVAHGGSLVFYAGLCKILGKGRVVGVDVEIRPHNRKALEAHPLSGAITLIERSSVDRGTAERVRDLIRPGEAVMVMLDANHSKAHVLQELELYAPLVTPGSYIVAMDGIKEWVAGRVRTTPDWIWDHPAAAVAEFARTHPEFAVQPPPFLFNESALTRQDVTYWPGGYLRRVS